MWNLRRRKHDNGNGNGSGATALAEPPAPAAGELAALEAEIARLSAENRSEPSLETERRLLAVRHELGVARTRAAAERPAHAAADTAALPVVASGLPEITPGALTPGLLRAGILRDGCVLVRGLIDRDRALAFAERIDRAFAERDRHEGGETAAPGFYEEFTQLPGVGGDIARDWIKMGGGVLAADSPSLAFEMFEMFEQARLPELVGGYLGEAPLISVDKTTLRKADPSVAGAWHQDGAFMGDVRALNLWLSLSRCGDESPGLDIVPRRLDGFVTAGTSDVWLSYQVSDRIAAEAAGDRPIIRPIFEPGDALFFDDLFLHKTGSDPAMPKPRFAIENWFFGPSAFPGEYSPLAV